MNDQERIAQWEDPPERGKDGSGTANRYAVVVDTLRSSKGRWALLAPRHNEQAARSLAANIRKGRLAAFAPEGAFEASYSDTRVWVRYVGEPQNVPNRDAGSNKVDAATSRAVRAWAQARNIAVPARGRVSADLVRQWRAATRGDEQVSEPDDDGQP